MSFTPGELIALDWANRVIRNHGGAVSKNSVSAITQFADALLDAGVWNQLIAVNVFAPDGLIAARTPVLVGGGSDPWLMALNDAIPATLDVNGWHSADAGGIHVLRTGIIPSNIPSFSASNGGLTVYLFSIGNGANAARAPIGCFDIAGKFCALDLGTTPGASYASDLFQNTNFASSAKVTITLPTIPGYYSGNRTGPTQNDLYFATSASPHANIATSSVASALGPPNREIAVAGFNSTGNFNGIDGNTVSFAAIHNGLTADQSLALFSSVQALRQAFGGGIL